MTKKIIFFILTSGLIMSVLAPRFCSALEISDWEDFTYLEPEKTISMDFTDADLSNVLKIFSQQSGLNFIASDNVGQKRINLYLDQVPVKQALEMILSANNLTYEINAGSNIFVVHELKKASINLMTRVYPLQYATVPSSKLHTTLSSDDEESSGSLIPTEDNNSSGILGAIEAILTEDGSVIEDARTNSLIITDLPSQFALIEQTVARLDVRVPQILIEAEMLDVSKSTADKIGAKFGDTPIAFTGGERDHVYPWNQNRLLDKGYVFEEAEYRVGTISFQGLSVTLQFLRSQTDTRNLARPRILTLNNDTAEIAIRTDEAIGLSSSTTSSEGTATSVAEAERVETGIFLKVTPQANVETREITMAIEPKVIQARTGATFSGQTFKDPEERGSRSILRVIDGDTIVLGGLLRTDLDQTKTHVPVLGKLPIVGAAFRHKEKDETQRELIIFLTPHILDEALTPHIASSASSDFLREQSSLTGRHSTIDRELSHMEGQKFDAYR